MLLVVCSTVQPLALDLHVSKTLTSAAACTSERGAGHDSRMFEVGQTRTPRFSTTLQSKKPQASRLVFPLQHLLAFVLYLSASAPGSKHRRSRSLLFIHDSKATWNFLVVLCFLITTTHARALCLTATLGDVYCSTQNTRRFFLDTQT